MSDNFLSWEDAVKWLTSQPDKKQLVEDCYFDESIDEAVHRYWKSKEWHEINKLITVDKGRAVDIGAGRGIASFALAKEGWSVEAIEPDSSELVGAGAINSIASKYDLPITVHSSFGENINSQSSSVDLVFARQVLHHSNNLQELCKELFRILKPSGQLIAVRDHVITRQSDLPAFFNKHPLHNLYGGENAYKSTEYLAALKEAGFKVKKVIRSFDSEINYAPYTKDTLRSLLVNKIGFYPFRSVLNTLLQNDFIFDKLLTFLSFVDNRPGRLYSFVCYKPDIN